MVERYGGDGPAHARAICGERLYGTGVHGRLRRSSRSAAPQEEDRSKRATRGYGPGVYVRLAMLQSLYLQDYMRASSGTNRAALTSWATAPAESQRYKASDGWFFRAARPEDLRGDYSWVATGLRRKN